MWIPCQRLDWLGITWDSARRGTIEIVDRRVVKIMNTIDSIIASDFVLSARRLASLTGQIISTAPFSGNISRIMTRHCIMSTLSAQHWDSEVKGRFTRYDFAAYDKLTTSLRHVLGPFTRERHLHLQN